MAITFTKQIPDELWIDSFAANNALELSYSGPATVSVLVDNMSGTFVDYDGVTPYNEETRRVVIVDASAEPDVAYYIHNRSQPRPEHEFETENLPGGLTYDKITNPTIYDYYTLRYDVENSSWDWELILREPKTIIYYTAEKYKKYIEDNTDKFSTATLQKKATDYITTLTTLMTTGKGSIPQWKLIEFSASEVPIPPGELINAIGVLPPQ